MRAEPVCVSWQEMVKSPNDLPEWLLLLSIFEDDTPAGEGYLCMSGDH